MNLLKLIKQNYEKLNNTQFLSGPYSIPWSVNIEIYLILSLMRIV